MAECFCKDFTFTIYSEPKIIQTQTARFIHLTIMYNYSRILFSHISGGSWSTGTLTLYMFYIKKHILLLYFCNKTFTFATESKKEIENHSARLAYVIARS